jgi:hypothetical protein
MPTFNQQNWPLWRGQIAILCTRNQPISATETSR